MANVQDSSMVRTENVHVILSCHQVDHDVMATIIYGMEVHSDFVAFDLNLPWNHERMKEVVNGEMGNKPLIDAWHGYFWPTFPVRTLLGLMESVQWQVESCVQIIVQRSDTGFTVHSLQQFSKAVTQGEFGPG